MNISGCGIEFIAEFESFVDHVYDDSTGVLTIGFGTTTPSIIAAYRNRRCTIAEAQGWFLGEVDQQYGPAVNALGLTLGQAQFDALVSFAYNLGAGIFSHTTIHAALYGDWSQVPAAMAVYSNPNDPQIHAGLLRRRHREGAMFARGDYGFPCAPGATGRHYTEDGDD